MLDAILTAGLTIRCRSTALCAGVGACRMITAHMQQGGACPEGNKI